MMLMIMMIPWRREQQLTPVFLPGESHGQKSLAGYGPCIYAYSVALVVSDSATPQTVAHQDPWASLVAQTLKNPPSMWETWV